MDDTRISLTEFMDRHPPGKRRESVISAHGKEILLLRKKGYTIPQIVTFFELVVGQKVSRFAIRDYLSARPKKKPKPVSPTDHVPTIKEPKKANDTDKQETGKETSPESRKPLSRPAKQQKREDLASKYDT